ncbi:MAG: flagellar hook-associated protein FlgK [Nitrospinales bacterium]
MGSNVFSVLNTGRVGLLSHQLAIEVTGQNIANVQTEGFSRQKVALEAATPRSVGLGQLGTGVRVAGIERAHDSFLFSQIVGENSSLGEFKARQNAFDQMETLFNDGLGGSLNNSLSDFFSSLQDLSNNPSGLAERAVVRGNAQSLASVFNNLGNQLFDQRVNLDNEIGATATEVSSLISQIAQMNKAVHENETSQGFGANDLRDQRDRLVNQLAEKIDVTVVNEQNGLLNLTLSNGRPLVLGLSTFSLSTRLNGDNNGFRDILLDDGQGNLTNITSDIKGGKLKGLLDMRDVELPASRDKVDRLAAGFIQEFNRVHGQGFGSDGSTGVDFFRPLSPTVSANTGNTGSAQVSMSNANPNQVSVDKFEITITGANSFSLTNLTTGAAAGAFTFASGSAFNLAGGLAVTINGAPAVGDRFTFSVSENASTLIRVDDAVLNDAQKIAAGTTLGGDGDNARQLANIQNRLAFNGVSIDTAGSGMFTFDDFYNSIVSQVGVSARATRTTMTQQEGVMVQLTNRRESADGVSIDEEMINLIKFQQAFAASARLISTVDEMMNILQDRI